MEKENSPSGVQDYLKMLRRKYYFATNQLQLARSKGQIKRLHGYIEELKIDMAWLLLECGKFEEGLSMYSSVFGKQYREKKYVGIGRALTEMKRYGEAKNVLEKGLKEFPKSYALWEGLGILHDALGEHLEALNCFEAAIRNF